MAALKKLLADAVDGEAPQYDLPEFPAPVVRAPVADFDVVMFSSGDDEPGASSPPPLPPPRVPGSPIPIEAPEGGAAVVEDLVVAEEGAAADVIPVPVAGDWPARLEGMPLRKISGRRGGDHAFFGRLGLACPCPEHESCQVTRSTQMLVAELGREAPLAFLGCWAENWNQVNHKQWKPNLSEMRSYKARRLDTGLATA